FFMMRCDPLDLTTKKPTRSKAAIAASGRVAGRSGIAPDPLALVLWVGFFGGCHQPRNWLTALLVLIKDRVQSLLDVGECLKEALALTVHARKDWHIGGVAALIIRDRYKLDVTLLRILESELRGLNLHGEAAFGYGVRAHGLRFDV